MLWVQQTCLLGRRAPRVHHRHDLLPGLREGFLERRESRTCASLKIYAEYFDWYLHLFVACRIDQTLQCLSDVLAQVQEPERPLQDISNVRSQSN